MKNTCAYALKTVATLAVVIGHTDLSKGLNGYVNILIRFVIPLFFLYSGYFSYAYSNKKLAKNGLKILRLAFVTLCVYAIYTPLYRWFMGDDVWQEILSWFSPQALIGLVLFNEPAVGPHLWFLFALSYCYGLQILLSRMKMDRKIGWAIPILLAAQLALDVGLSAVTGGGIPNKCVRNFLFMGMPFFMLGRLVRQNEPKLLGGRHLSVRNLLIILAAGIGMIYFEGMLYKFGDLYPSGILISISLFLLSLKYPGAFSGTKLAKIGETHSSFIYRYHYLMVRLVRFPAIWIGIDKAQVFYYTHPILTFALTLAASYAYEAIVRRIKQKPA